MQINPYESPPVSIVNLDSALPLGPGSEVDRERFTKLLRKLAVIRMGDGVLTMSIASLGLVLFFKEPGAKSLATSPSLAALTLIALAMAMVYVGLFLVVAVPLIQGKLAIFALVLQTMATIGVVSFVLAVIQRQFVGGLLPLFGAAAFAMLLTSQAIVALVIRSLASSYRIVDAVRWSYCAVIGYALCATVTSAWSLRLIPLGVSPRIVVICMCVSALAATASRFHSVTIMRSQTN